MNSGHLVPNVTIFFKLPQNKGHISIKKTVLESLLIKLQASGPATLLKRDSRKVLLREFCDCFKNILFTEHFRAAASGWCISLGLLIGS